VFLCASASLRQSLVSLSPSAMTKVFVDIDEAFRQ
jgi:hypothetical protein